MLNLPDTIRQPVTPDRQFNAEAHDRPPRHEVLARTLDWDQPLPEWVAAHHPDLIMYVPYRPQGCHWITCSRPCSAADVTYNTSSFPSLVRTLRDLLKPLTGQRPPFLLAYKQRDEAERDLWDMLKAEDIQLHLVDTIVGAEEEGGVEIWVGKASNA